MLNAINYSLVLFLLLGPALELHHNSEANIPRMQSELYCALRTRVFETASMANFEHQEGHLRKRLDLQGAIWRERHWAGRFVDNRRDGPRVQADRSWALAESNRVLHSLHQQFAHNLLRCAVVDWKWRPTHEYFGDWIVFNPADDTLAGYGRLKGRDISLPRSDTEGFPDPRVQRLDVIAVWEELAWHMEADDAQTIPVDEMSLQMQPDLAQHVIDRVFGLWDRESADWHRGWKVGGRHLRRSSASRR